MPCVTYTIYRYTVEYRVRSNELPQRRKIEACVRPSACSQFYYFNADDASQARKLRDKNQMMNVSGNNTARHDAHDVINHFRDNHRITGKSRDAAPN